MCINACKTSIEYAQLFKTTGVNLKESPNNYTFENDTVRIVYSFWAEKGIMAFRVFNKTDKPLYIDWKKSTYISNGLKYNYYEDKIDVTTNWSNISLSEVNRFTTITGYINSTLNLTAETIKTRNITTTDINGETTNSIEGRSSSTQNSAIYSTGSSNSSVKKIERITFSPPKTYFDRYSNYLTNSYYTDWKSGGYTQVKETRNDNPKYQTTVSSKKFTANTSPLNFRNFLTFSFKEDFSSEFFVDNEFYVKEVIAMDKRHIFKYTKRDDFDWIYDGILSKYVKGIDFFIGSPPRSSDRNRP